MEVSVTNKKAVYCIDAGNDWSFFAFLIQAKAQKSDEIIPYLEERFKQENIPVIEITIISHEDD